MTRFGALLICLLLPLSVQARGKAALAGTYYSPKTISTHWKIFDEQLVGLQLQISPSGNVNGNCQIYGTVQGQPVAPSTGVIQGRINRSKKSFLLKTYILRIYSPDDDVISSYGTITGEFQFIGHSRKLRFRGALFRQGTETPIKLFR
ncbi:MAG TPA: hypothetical protein VNB29_09185 [Chthoniobacterales bacterium]|nr:hypothetical protein [Chthoniobacterales bacterium]